MIHAKQGEAPYRIDISVRDHALVGDEGPSHGGQDAGPSPFDLVLSGLAACTLITLRMYAERKGWDDFDVAGRFAHRVEDGANLIDRHLEISGVPDDGLERMRDIVERTPVTLALKAGFGITTSLQGARAVAR